MTDKTAFQHPYVKIVSRRYYMPESAPKRSRPSVVCTLACGHTRRFRGSDEPKPGARVACLSCPRV